MDAHAEGLQVYRDLAELHEQRGQIAARDRNLVLAADAALAAGMPDEAERLRQRLLQTTRHHLLKPYASFTEAAQAPDVRTYLRDLRLNYPVEAAQDALQALRNAPPENAPNPPAPAVPPVPRAGQVPPTAPLLDVFGVQPIDKQPAPRPRPPAPAPPRRAAPPVPAPPPRAQPVPTWPGQPERPARRPERPAVTAAHVPLDRAVPREPPQAANGNGGWIGMILVGFVVMAGLLLALVTLGRPFLPAEWLP